MDAYEWIEVAALIAVLVLLWDMHGYRRSIARDLRAISDRR